MQPKLVLIRGLPGSGKSTLAKAMDGYVHYEADMFFLVNDKFVYDGTKISQAHDWCVASTKAALHDGKRVVVSNTFSKLWELQRYVELGFPLEIVEAQGNWESIHDVPKDKIEMMKARWEPLTPSFKNKLNDLARNRVL